MRALAIVSLVAGLLAARQATAQVSPQEHATLTKTRVLLVPTQTLDAVDPVVGRFVDRQLQRSLERAEYGVTRRRPASYPPDMAELWRASHAASAHYAVFAVVWAEAGRYRVQLRVACRDGSGPFYAQGEAGAEELQAVVDALLQQTLPAPEPAPAENAPPADQRAAEQPAPTRPAFTQTRLALHSDAAIGVAEPAFYNHLLGARLDFRFSRALSLGGYLAYANLEGRDKRAHNLLAYLLLDHRTFLDDDGSLGVPLRLAIGYLMRNGAYLRVGSGLAVELGRAAELVFDLPAPAFWVARKKLLFSVNLGVELAFRL